MSSVARVGIVGSGIFGQMHLKAFTQLQSEGKAELLAIADIVKEKREKAAEEYSVTPYEDYREMIEKENLDAISVVTPDAFHADIATTGLEMGCHVLTEKPIATTMDDCRKIVYGGYGIESIMEFADHVNYILGGGNIRDLDGLYANAHDGLEVSKICVGAHKSTEAGGKVVYLDTL